MSWRDLKRDPKIGIVILTQSRSELAETSACLYSLRILDYPNFAVYVVDNDFPSFALGLCDVFPSVEILVAGGNRGVAGGRNLGANKALEDGAEYVLFLDNDVEVAKDFLTQLVCFAERDESIGGVQPLIYFFAMSSTVLTLGGRYYAPFSHSKAVAARVRDVGQFREAVAIDWISGCAGLFKRQSFEKAGWLDESFSPYSCEDVDWGLRLRKVGFKLYGLPSAKIWHKVHYANEKSPNQIRNTVRGHILLIRKHSSPLTLPLSILWFVAYWVRLTLRYFVNRDIGRVLSVVHGVRDGFEAIELGLGILK